MMYYLIYFISAILVADFLTGLFHWWEDRYGNPDWPILGDIVVKPNIFHHKSPRAFTAGSYLKRNYTTFIPSFVLAAICYYYQNYFLALAFVIASQSNEVHCWEHMKTNWLIRNLQSYKILQDVKTHALHHKRPYDTNYCVMTMLVNPVLNRVSFWYCLERTVYFFTGINPRKERELY